MRRCNVKFSQPFDGFDELTASRLMVNGQMIDSLLLIELIVWPFSFIRSVTGDESVQI